MYCRSIHTCEKKYLLNMLKLYFRWFFFFSIFFPLHFLHHLFVSLQKGCNNNDKTESKTYKIAVTPLFLNKSKLELRLSRTREQATKSMHATAFLSPIGLCMFKKGWFQSENTSLLIISMLTHPSTTCWGSN